jgi:hypothetical protein
LQCAKLHWCFGSISTAGLTTNLNPPKSRNRAEIAYLLRPGTKLNRDNHAAWEIRMRKNLAGEELAAYLDGTFPLNLLWTADEQAVWVRTDAFVTNVLLNNMEDELVTLCGECSTAAETWSTLRQQFGVAGSTGLINIIIQLINTKYKVGDDITSHINTFRGLRREANLINQPVADELIAIFLRLSMPSTWDSAFAALPETITTAEIERRLVEFNSHQTTRAKLSGSDTAYGAFDQKKPGSNSGNRPMCDNCRRQGHTKEKCFQPGGGQEGQAPWQKDKKSGKDKRDSVTASR